MAMKDLSWNQTLAGPDRDLAIEAFDKELNSLLNEILVPIPKDHPDRKEAEKLADVTVDVRIHGALILIITAKPRPL